MFIIQKITFNIKQALTVGLSLLRNLVALNSKTAIRNRLLAWCLVFFLAGLGYYYHPSDVFWIKQTVDKGGITQDERGNKGYVAFMGFEKYSGQENHKSTAVLYENDKSLGPSNALFDRIVRRGLGRYIFWDGTLYFSTSDNSDPRENGRNYELAIPFQVYYFWRIVFGLLGFYLLFWLVVPLGLAIAQKFPQVYTLAAILYFIVVALPIMYYARGERSPWVLTLTSFPGAQAEYGVFGYSYAMGEMPLMAEDDRSVQQSLMYSGSIGNLSLIFYDVRGLYGFLATLFSSIVGLLPAFWLLNLLGWGGAAYCTWRLALGMSENRLAAFLGVILVAGGLGFVLHSNDYNPHLISFVMYYIGLLLIYESRVWLEPRTLRSHLIIGAYLALAGLCYDNGLYLAGGYILVSIWRNRWWHVALASFIGLSAKYVWIIALNLLNAYVSGGWNWVNVYGDVQDYLSRSLSRWGALPISQFAPEFFKGILQFLFFEFPLITLLGFVAWIVLPWSRSQRWFLLVFFLLPFAGGLVFLYTSTTRGYLVYGSSMLIYVPLSIWMARWLESRWSTLMAMGILGVLLIVGIQLFWSTAFLWGYVVPAKMFFGFGYLEWIPKYLSMFHMPPAYSLTGAEPTPVMFGGDASLKQAGLYVESRIPEISFSFPFALAARTLLSFYFGLFVALAASTRKRMRQGLMTVILGLWLTPALLPQISPPKPLPLFSTFSAIYVPADQEWVYSVALSDEFIEKMKQYSGRDVKIQFMFNGNSRSFQTRIVGSGNSVLGQIDDGAVIIKANVSLDELIAVLERSNKIEVYLKTQLAGVNMNNGTSIFGWQRNGLPGRDFYELESGEHWEGFSLPAFELRILDASDKILLIGY